MGLYAAGQVAFLLFPFSDLSRNKLRPAMLLAQAGHEDWIVCQITSNPFGENGSLPLTAADFASGSLPHTSYVRPGKVFTAHASLIGPIVGTLTDETFVIVRDSVIAVIKGR